MSRRTGQMVTLKKAANGGLLDGGMDVPGEYGQEAEAGKICPISGSGRLFASERKRRAREIIAASGADTRSNTLIGCQATDSDSVALRKQAQRWLEHLRDRKRKPVASEHNRGLGAHVEELDQSPLSAIVPSADVNNGVLKKLVRRHGERGVVAEDDRKLHPGSENGCSLGHGRRWESGLPT